MGGVGFWCGVMDGRREERGGEGSHNVVLGYI